MICLPMYFDKFIYSTLHKNKLWSCIEASSRDKNSFAFSSDGVIAVGASMQHIFPVVHAERNVKAADAA